MITKLAYAGFLFTFLLSLSALLSCNNESEKDRTPVYVPARDLSESQTKASNSEITIIFGEADTVQIIQSKRNSLITDGQTKITCKKTSLDHTYLLNGEVVRRTKFRPDSIEIYDRNDELLWYLKAAPDHLALVSPGSIIELRAHAVGDVLQLEKNGTALCEGSYNSAISRYKLLCGNKPVQLDASFYHPGFSLCGSSSISRIDLELAINELALIYGPVI